MVIAIVAILTALLVPSLTTARLAALRVTCASNLHTIGIGAIGYANDHDGETPVQGLRDICESGCVDPTSAGFGGGRSGLADTQWGLYLLWTGDYVDDLQRYRCPADSLSFMGNNPNRPADNWRAGSNPAQDFCYRGRLELREDLPAAALASDNWVDHDSGARIWWLVPTHEPAGYNVLRLNGSVDWHDDQDGSLYSLGFAYAYAGAWGKLDRR